MKKALLIILLFSFTGGYCQLFKEQDSCKLKLRNFDLSYDKADTCCLFYVNQKAYAEKAIKRVTKWSEKEDKKIDGFYYPNLFFNTFFNRSSLVFDSILKKEHLIDLLDNEVLDYRSFLLEAKATHVKARVIGYSETQFSYTFDMEYHITNKIDEKLRVQKVSVSTGFIPQARFKDKNNKATEQKIMNYIDSVLVKCFDKFFDKQNIKRIEMAGDSLQKARIAGAPFSLGPKGKPVGKEASSFASSVVTLKLKDGHGSGCIVSPDGYVVSTYYVTKDDTLVKVLYGDGNSAEAEVVRRNPELDLALLKIKGASGLTPLILNPDEKFAFGQDIFAIGTAVDINLGQSVSKGVISAIRKTSRREFVQMDVKISPGSNGGALMNTSGELIGVITAKLIGRNTEGIAFGIPAKTIISGLNLKYTP